MAVYKSRNMTESAKQLYMTQPSVSQAIRELEEHYEVVLFERLHRQLYPTFAADTLNSYAGKIIDLFNEMEQEINGESLLNHIRIGANYTVGASMMSDFVHQLHNKEADAKVNVFINKASVLKEMLRKNEVDLILIEDQKKECDLVGECFAADHVTIVTTPTHRLVQKEKVYAKDLVDEKLLMRERGAGARDQFEADMLQKGYEVKPFWESISVTALIKATEEFDGVAILPYEAVKEQIALGSLVELTVEDMKLTRTLSIFYHKDKYVTKLMSEFIEIVKNSSKIKLDT